MIFVWIVICSLGSIACVISHKTVVTHRYVEGYYWRDYTGYIPSDAVPAGKDDKGQTTYIGLALHPGGFLTPGVISKDNDKISYEFQRIENLESLNGKILCSQRPEQLIWYPVDIKHSINDLNGNHLIIAGHDSHGPLAIGRKVKGSEIAVGKVLIFDSEFGSIYTTKDGKGFQEGTYEVLVFRQTNITEVGECDGKIINVNVY